MTSDKSHTDQAPSTRIGRAVAGEARKYPGKSGFLLIPEGIKALAARLQLADRAQSSIDAQYYEIDDDLAGHLFIEALLRAASRGVRVRLLLDDYRTKGHDAGLATLRDHPNFEMRMYNPFERRTSRILEGITSFSRVNRRMHNKSFTVDNQITIIGGRNIGDPYFNVSEEVNFSDLDVLCIGPVVTDVSGMFEEYWTSPSAVPVDNVSRRFGSPTTSLAKILDRVSGSKAKAARAKYIKVLSSLMIENLQRDLSVFTWAKYQLAYDLPGKTTRDKKSTVIRRLLVDAFDKANKEVVLISPYFVPRLHGIKRFASLRKRNVEVAIVTNSLASNNQIYAHGGYAPVRKPLLKIGVKLFELSAAQNIVRKNRHGSKPGKATLHTKAFAIDRQKLFIGSFNFDPRSANINTEMGVFIDSPLLAAALVEGFEKYSKTQSYELRLTKKNRLRWHGYRYGQAIKTNRDPHASLALRAAAKLAQLLPIRGQV